jgi:hypothetical protein
MAMKKLYTCGCSFMSVGTQDHGITSFLNLYSKQKQFDHVSLARSGATNFLIRLQIEEAIRLNADFIVIGATSNDRMEVPIPARSKEIAWPIRIKDIEYRGYLSASAENVDSECPKIISDSINNWTSNNYRNVPHDNFRRKEITPEVIAAMKHYVTHLHNDQLDQMKNYFVIADGLRKLISLGKEFIFLAGPLRGCDWNFVGHRRWVETEPWDLPHGIHPAEISHNPQTAHDEFARVLVDMTPTWTNG